MKYWRYCLIIDDKKQDDEIAQLETFSKEKGFPIKCFYFNPLDRRCLREETLKDNTKLNYLDLDKLLETLNVEFTGTPINLIASDYKLEDEGGIDGLQIVQFLKEKWRGKNIPCILYSSDYTEINERLQSKVLEVIENPEKLRKYVEEYLKTKPEKALDRTTYYAEIYTYLRNNKMSLNIKLHNKLNEHPDKEFKNIFPSFEGWALKKLADLVLDKKRESDEFEDEFLDRSVDHFIYLKN
jgi:CheY-like chemotaxis protein